MHVVPDEHGFVCILFMVIMLVMMGIVDSWDIWEMNGIIDIVVLED